MKVAIFKNRLARKKWSVVFPNGHILDGFETADRARDAAARNGFMPIVLNGSPLKINLHWHFVQVGKSEAWRAELGGQIVATAERSNPEDFWKTSINGEELAPLSSITEFATRVAQQIEKEYNNASNKF